MLAEVESGGSGSLDVARMTFADLADYYQRTYLIDPEYRDGRKIAGLRSKYDFEHRLKALKFQAASIRLARVAFGRHARGVHRSADTRRFPAESCPLDR